MIRCTNREARYAWTNNISVHPHLIEGLERMAALLVNHQHNSEGGLAQLVATLVGSTKLLYAGPG